MRRAPVCRRSRRFRKRRQHQPEVFPRRPAPQAPRKLATPVAFPLEAPLDMRPFLSSSVLALRCGLSDAAGCAANSDLSLFETFSNVILAQLSIQR